MDHIAYTLEFFVCLLFAFPALAPFIEHSNVDTHQHYCVHQQFGLFFSS